MKKAKKEHLLPDKSKKNALRQGFPFRVAFCYIVIAGAWILLSDWAVSIFTSDPVNLRFIQTYKGWAYVLITGLILYAFLRREWNFLEAEMKGRQLAELELRQLNVSLEERVAERTAELERSKTQAEAADRLKSSFLATMSHELRTPLNSIVGFTGIMIQELAGPLNDEQKKQLGMVQTSSRHLLALINDILDISKIEAGQLTLASSEFDLAQSLQKVVDLIRPLASAKKLELEAYIEADMGQICLDQRRFEQIVINLLNNAVKFTEVGCVTLTCRKEAASCMIAVADSGIGMAEDDIKKLFQPFHQIDSGLARRHEGTGLGLSICSRLVSLMHGTIEVQSQPDKGSTFIVRIPFNQPQAIARQASA